MYLVVHMQVSNSFKKKSLRMTVTRLLFKVVT